MLCRRSRVRFQKPTQPGCADDLGHFKIDGWFRGFVPSGREVIAGAVAAFSVVPGQKLVADVVEVPFRPDHKRVQALEFERLNGSLDVGLLIGRIDRRPHDGSSRILKQLIELPGELCVVIVNQVLSGETRLLGHQLEVSCLLCHPGRIRVQRAGCNPHSSRAQVQKHQQVQVDRTAKRPHSLRAEIAFPQRRRVALQEVVPGIDVVLRDGRNACVCQDSGNGLAGQSESQLPQLAHQSPVPESGVFANADDYFTHFSLSSRPADDSLFRLRPSPLLQGCLPHPTAKSVIGHNGHQVTQLAAELSAGPQESPPLLFGRLDSLGQAGPENSILCFEVGDLPGKFLLGDRGEQGKQRMQKSHGATRDDREKRRIFRGGRTFETTLEGVQNNPRPLTVKPPQSDDGFPAQFRSSGCRGLYSGPMIVESRPTSTRLPQRRSAQRHSGARFVPLWQSCPVSSEGLPNGVRTVS